MITMRRDDVVPARRRWNVPLLLGVVAAALGAACRDRPVAGAIALGSSDAPSAAEVEDDVEDYVLVSATGATAFMSPFLSPFTRAGGATGGDHLGKGFGFVATGERRSVDGRRYLRIRDGRWLLENEVSHVRPSRFSGVTLAPGEALRFGWALAPAVPIRATAEPDAPVIATRPRQGRITFSGSCRRGACPLALGWVRSADVAVPVMAPRPGGVGSDERWVDIDLSSQTLVAYEGDTPRFATLIAAGIGEPGSPLATPQGVFRIRSKHALVRMDNLEHIGVEPYAYDVPLTQYFSEGKALHAALWHDQFGRPRSHGCVNLAPADARWLFAFTAPNLAPGAAEVAATRARPGTLIRVRGQWRDPLRDERDHLGSGPTGSGTKRAAAAAL